LGIRVVPGAEPGLSTTAEGRVEGTGASRDVRLVEVRRDLVLEPLVRRKRGIVPPARFDVAGYDYCDVMSVAPGQARLQDADERRCPIIGRSYVLPKRTEDPV
jgi:hypothetical protein